MAFISGGMPVTAQAIGDVTVSYRALIGLGAANRQMVVPLPGVKADDILSARPIGAVPSGYNIGACFCIKDDEVVVIICHPPLSIAGEYNIALRIIRIMSNS